MMTAAVVLLDGPVPDDSTGQAAPTTVDIISKRDHRYHHTLSPARDKMSDDNEPSSSLMDAKATFLTGLAIGLE